MTAKDWLLRLADEHPVIFMILVLAAWMILAPTLGLTGGGCVDVLDCPPGY